MSQDNPADSAPVLRTLVVDDEVLARVRLKALLAEVQQPRIALVGEAESAEQALLQAGRCRPDLVLLDIHMPGMDGMALARELRRQQPLCRLVFVTAYGEHALEAFEVEATDYLTKPVRRERLQAALDKVAAQVQQQALAAPAPTALPAGAALLMQERGRTQRVPLAEVVYARAELKYVTLHTRSGRELIWDGTLTQLEEQYPAFFIRVHRSVLVQRQAMQELKKTAHPELGEVWLLQLTGVPDKLPVSRRLLPSVRQALLTL